MSLLLYISRNKEKKSFEKSGFIQNRIFLPVVYFDTSTSRNIHVFGTWNIGGNVFI